MDGRNFGQGAVRPSNHRQRMRVEALEDRRLLAVNVVPTVETDDATAADDVAIWIHPTNAAQSTIIGTAKTSSNALRVYDLAGNELQRVAAAEINNVDLRYNFPLAGQPTTIVTGSNRSNDSIVVYRVNPATRLLENVAARTIGTGMSIYGLAMYVSPTTGKYYTFATSESGQVQQWELFDNGANKVDATLVRSFNVGSQSEGLVADDVLGWLYVGEENVGIWKYSAEPSGGTARTQVDSTGGGGHLDADVEGLTIYYESDGTGYLIASSQGASEFAVYRREGTNQHLDNFKLIAGGGIDAVTDTDGIDVTNFPLGSAFPQGMFVAQDNDTNFKLARWDAIDAAFGGLLDVDTTWDPRAIGAQQNSTVVGRHIFYNESAYDGNNAAIQTTVAGVNNDDEDARDTTKTALLPGAGPATWANITGYDKGINGIMIDLSSGVDHSGLTLANVANNFIFKVGNNNTPDNWAVAPAPTALSVTPGGGVGGSDRVTITWATGAITKQWLEVGVLPTAQTGLAAGPYTVDPDGPGGATSIAAGDLFFFGNAVGGSGAGDTATAAPTNAADEIGARNNPHGFGNFALVTDEYDYNKDRSVNATDQIISRNNPTGFGTQLVKINIGTAGPFAPEGDSDGDGDGDAGIASALASGASDVEDASVTIEPTFAATEPSNLAGPSARESRWNGRPAALAAAAAWHSFGDKLRGLDGADELFGSAADDDLLDALASARSIASWRRR